MKSEEKQAKGEESWVEGTLGLRRLSIYLREQLRSGESARRLHTGLLYSLVTPYLVGRTNSVASACVNQGKAMQGRH